MVFAVGPGSIARNDYYGSVKFSWESTNYTSLAAYQSGPSQDANSVAPNPTLRCLAAGERVIRLAHRQVRSRAPAPMSYRADQQ
jgi:hypothetical protein